MSDRVTGEWLPLMDFSMRKGVSLSTLRRHIKANKVRYRVEGGKYLLFDGGSAEGNRPATGGDETKEPELHARVRLLEQQLRKANEENSELRMLIALYEEKSATF